MHLRVALVCGQVLAYSVNVQPSAAATKEYFSVFGRYAAEFDADFVRKVVAATQWVAAKHGIEDPTSGRSNEWVGC